MKYKGMGLWLSLLFAVLSVCACRQKEEFNPAKENFKMLDEYGLYDNTGAVFLYDRKIHQIGFDSEGSYFNMYTRSQNESVELRFSENVAYATKVSVEFKSHGIETDVDFSGEYTVINKDSQRIWLWHINKNYGIIIKNFI